MPIATPLTALLGITHPILSAPMDVIAGARLDGGGERCRWFWHFGRWLWRPGLAGGRRPRKLKDFSGPFGIGFITWSLAKQPELLDIALAAKPRAIMLSFGDPKPFAPQRSKQLARC